MLCCLFVASTSIVYLCVDVDGSVFLCKKKVCDAFPVAVKSIWVGSMCQISAVFCLPMFILLAADCSFVLRQIQSFTMPNNATPLPPWIEKKA